MSEPVTSGQPAPGPGSGGFFAELVRRPVMLGMLFITCMLVGLIAYDRIPIQLMPDGLVEPGLQVWVSNPGASAPENEEQVTRVLEEELRTLTGVKEINSGSNPDSVWIWVEFDADTDMDYAKAEVRDRCERARARLPNTVQELGIWSWNESDMPILYFALTHPGDSDRTDYLIDTVIRQRIEAVDGVGRIEIYGVLDDAMRILLDEDRVRAARMDLGALIERLSSDNFAMPMGEVSDGGRRILLRSDMRFESAQEIATYPIGQGLTLGDVGEVVQTKSVRNSLFRLNGEYAYFGEIQKDGQANVVATCRELETLLDELERDPKLAGEFGFHVVFNQGRFIELSLEQLRNTALQGGGLAVLILLVFLRRVRLTLCVALSIPVSVLLAIAWVYFGGGTFNVLTMTGITLAMGMLVDNAVVVVENITRLAEEGSGRDAGRRAAVEGAREVGLAVLLSTLTTVVVFLPMIFMTENPVLRIMFGQLGLPLCISLLISLAVALVFIPAAVARIVGPRQRAVEAAAVVVGAVASLPARAIGLVLGLLRILWFGVLRALFFLERGLLLVLAPLRLLIAAGILWLAWDRGRLAFEAYAGVEPLSGSGALLQAEVVPVLALRYGLPALLAAGIVLLGLGRWRARAARPPARPASFVPAGHSLLDMFIAGNRSLTAWTLEHRCLALAFASLALLSILIPRAGMTVAPFGQDDSTSNVRIYVDLENNFTLAQASDEIAHYERFLEERREQYGYENLAARFEEDEGNLSLYWETRRTAEERDAVVADLRETLPKIAGHRVSFRGDEAESQNQKNVVTWRITGPDSEVLNRLGAEAVELVRAIPGTSDVTSPLENLPEQVRVVFQPDLAQQFGVTPMSVFRNISWALRGWQLPRYQESGREIPLIIEYDGEEVAGLDTLRDLEIFTETTAVPLTSFADLEFAKGSRSIYRRNGKVAFTLQARVEDPTMLRTVSDAGFAALSSLELPRDYQVGAEDLVANRQDEEFGELGSALILSIVLVFLLMCILFEHLLLPVSVLFTIPYAVVGAFWTLYLTGTTMDSVGWIGIIILSGVVVNNGIVLIHRIHMLRAQGMPRTEAVLEGSTNRVRPILMTALTTIIGLLPMAISEPPSEGIDYRALATCVAGGLTLSTFFTLWVVPLAYTMLDDLAAAVVVRTHWALRRPVRARSAQAQPTAAEPTAA